MAQGINPRYSLTQASAEDKYREQELLQSDGAEETKGVSKFWSKLPSHQKWFVGITGPIVLALAVALFFFLAGPTIKEALPSKPNFNPDWAEMRNRMFGGKAAQKGVVRAEEPRREPWTTHTPNVRSPAESYALNWAKHRTVTKSEGYAKGHQMNFSRYPYAVVSGTSSGSCGSDSQVSLRVSYDGQSWTEGFLCMHQDPELRIWRAVGGSLYQPN